MPYAIPLHENFEFTAREDGTIVGYYPWVAKVALSFSMVVSLVAEFLQWTFSHLE